MITLKDIQLEKSVSTRRLHYTKSWTVYLDNIIYTVVLIFGFVLYPYLTYRYELDLENVNDRFIGYYVLPLIAFIGVYMAIRTFTQLRLKKIQTNQDCEQNKLSILNFAKTEGYNVRRKYNNCIILDKPKMDENYARTAVLLLKDKEIYFTFLQDNFRLNTPTFSTHLIFAWKLKNWIKKDAYNTRIEQEPKF
jgi:hypothetical protein